MPDKQIINSEQAPSAIGPYSQAVKVDHTVYCSGQIPLDPVSMQVVEGGVRAQTHQVLKNLTAVANAAGGSLADFVKLNVYLSDLGDFAVVNEVMQEYFSAPFPARAAIGVAALPLGVAVEVEGVMVV